MFSNFAIRTFIVCGFGAMVSGYMLFTAEPAVAFMSGLITIALLVTMLVATLQPLLRLLRDLPPKNAATDDLEL